MRKVTKVKSATYYKPGKAAEVYSKRKKPIKVSKTVTTTRRGKTKTKTTAYSPISYYGKQTKKITRS